MPKSPSARALRATVGALLVGAAAAPLAAQSPVTLDVFAARKESSQNPLFGGASLSTFAGPFGLRFGGGLNVGNGDGATYRTEQVPAGYCRRDFRCGRGAVAYTDGGSLGPSVNAWSADADFIVEPLRAVPALRALLLGFSPYGFAGIGRYESGAGSSLDTSRTMWSYGGGLRHALLGPVSLGAEARFRQPIDGPVTSPGAVSRQSWEYRVALSFGLGGHHRKAPAAGAPNDAPVRAPAAPDAPADAVRVASRVLDAADGYVNTPYHYGGASPSTGFDAAGFVQYVYAKEGVRLPRTAREMAGAGTEVSTRVGALRPGDLLFFANDGEHVDHVAIYVGHERIIHATASGEGVRYDDLADGARGQWFADHLVAARRVVDAARESGRSRDDAPDDELDRPDRAPRPSRVPQ